MSRPLRTLLAGLVLVAAVAAPAAAQDSNPLSAIQKQQRKLYKDVAPAVVFITVGDTLGSGFFISSDGVLLTNHHVVGEKDEVEVVLYDGTKTTGEVIETDDDWDLALVRTDVDGVDPLPLAGMGNVKVGDWVGSIGHGKGGVWTFTNGMISNIYPSKKDRPLIQTQIPIYSGNSGGPVFDKEGRAVAVVTLKHRDADNMNLAIPMQKAIGRLDKLDDTCDCLVVETAKDAPIYVDGSMVGKGPRVVVPAEEKTYEIVVVVDGKPHRREIEWPKTRSIVVE